EVCMVARSNTVRTVLGRAVVDVPEETALRAVSVEIRCRGLEVFGVSPRPEPAVSDWHAPTRKAAPHRAVISTSRARTLATLRLTRRFVRQKNVPHHGARRVLNRRSAVTVTSGSRTVTR